MAEKKVTKHLGFGQALRQPKTTQDTEWYKKRRDEVPAINVTGLSENPFMHLLKASKENAEEVTETA